MRPSMKAMYCETRASTHWPSLHSTIRVSGSRVVSVWNGLPSTWPLKITDCRSLIGNSGLVISVGFENVGAVMSTRLLSGATGSLSRLAAASSAWLGCGIVSGAAVAFASAPSPPQAPSASAAISGHGRGAVANAFSLHGLALLDLHRNRPPGLVYGTRCMGRR